MSDRLPSSSQLSFIPQVFFDLIARVAPGLLVLLSAWVVVPAHPWLSAGKRALCGLLSTGSPPTLLLILTALLISYGLALVASGVWNLYERLRRWWRAGGPDSWDREVQEMWETVGPKFRMAFGNEAVGAVSRPDSVALLYDWVRLKEPVAGARLVKLRAELHLCQTLIVGWLGLTLLGLLDVSSDLSWESTWVRLLLPLLAAGSVAMLRQEFRRRLVWGLCNHWYLLHLDCGPLGKSPASDTASHDQNPCGARRDALTP